MEKYTLYFKMNNKYEHEKNMPIISLDLKSMDKYTGLYGCYVNLFESLPIKVRKFIIKEIDSKINLNDEEHLKKSFCLLNTKEEEFPILLSESLDVIYITPSELTNLILDEKMDYTELQKTLLKSRVSSNIKKRYEFFTYLYDTYVKNKKIICMMDSYDINKKLPMLKENELMIGAISTEKDNLILLTRKIGQRSKDRRDLAIKFKELRIKLGKKEPLIDIELVRDRIDSNKKYDDEIINNFENFEINYNKEYEV